MAKPRVLLDRIGKRRAREVVPTEVVAAAGPTDPIGTAPRRRPLTTENDTFFEALGRSGDLGAAAAAATRRRLRAGDSQTRLLAQALQQHGGAVRQIGDICAAVATVFEDRPTNALLPSAAWQAFNAADLGEVLRLAPAEYLRTAFGHDPSKATDALAGLLSGAHRTEADAADWLDIAATSFLAGFDDLSRAALDRAEAELTDVDQGRAHRRLRADARWLRSWYSRRGDVTAAEAPAIAVLGHRTPDRAASARNLGDYLDSLATLAQLVRHHPDVTDGADEPFAPLVEKLRSRVTDIAPSMSSVSPVSPVSPAVTLYSVDKDASSWARIPDGTWVIYTGALPRPLFGVRRDLPLDERLRPIFLSVHVDSPWSLSDAAVEYLCKHGPVGCRDWSTVLLLQAAGVPAFFAGSVTTTLDSLAVPAPTPAGTLAIDLAGRGDTELSQHSDAVRGRGLADNLQAALDYVDAIAAAEQVRTGRIEGYLAARALATPVEFVQDAGFKRAQWGLLDLDDNALETMRRGNSDKLSAAYGAILSGKSADEVFAVWRAACADDVVRAEAFRSAVPPMPPPVIDIAAACATIRAASVTRERSVPRADHSEINVEFSLDGAYKHQLEVVLDSIVTHSSRPVRAFVLCREHSSADYDRMAAAFPEVSFVWLPTDDVDYGSVQVGCNSVATLDRLLLPDLLPEVSRIVHHDLDALCLVDLAELYDTELAGAPVAGRTSPHQNKLSGFGTLMRRVEIMDRDRERAQEYLLRTHTRNRFGYDVFNAGVMVFDLDVMRADDFCRNFLPYVERFGLNDNDVVNIYTGANRVALDPGWNWRPWFETLDEPKIAHWAGARLHKPWNDNWVMGQDLWRAGEERVARRHADAKAQLGMSTKRL